jgi:hypothetical protein
LVLLAILGALREGAPVWVLAILAAFGVVFVLAFTSAYFFLMIKNPDALRSEKFQLSKIAIERSMIGDNITGFLEPEKQPLTLPSAESKADER